MMLSAAKIEMPCGKIAAAGRRSKRQPAAARPAKSRNWLGSDMCSRSFWCTSLRGKATKKVAPTAIPTILRSMSKSRSSSSAEPTSTPLVTKPRSAKITTQQPMSSPLRRFSAPSGHSGAPAAPLGWSGKGSSRMSGKRAATPTSAPKLTMSCTMGALAKLECCSGQKERTCAAAATRGPEPIPTVLTKKTRVIWTFMSALDDRLCTVMAMSCATRPWPAPAMRRAAFTVAVATGPEAPPSTARAPRR
mmetsp:Transcript_115828/g.360772  ORF Transcript_115828/g.360772 Transcript_115828/m.360772 type:complete len:248 (+) Transcript_115828:174-917(+)